MVAEKVNPVTPNRAFPFVFEMRQPVRGLDHYRSSARFGPGELDSIRSTHVPNSLRGLLHRPTPMRSPSDSFNAALARSLVESKSGTSVSS